MICVEPVRKKIGTENVKYANKDIRKKQNDA